MQQQIGVGADRLVRRRRDLGVAGVQFGAMARGAAELVEQPSTRVRLGIAHVAPSGHGERAGVERHALELGVVELGLAAVDRRLALGLGVGAVLFGVQPARDPDVAVERAGRLLLDGRDVGLPSEPADDQRARRVEHVVHASGDAVTVRVVGIGEREQRVVGDRFEQADAEHRRRDARRDHDPLGERAVSEVLDRVGGGEQRVRRPVRVRARDLGPLDHDAAFGQDAVDRPVLQLAAVHGVGPRSAVGPDDGEAEEQTRARDRRPTSAVRRGRRTRGTTSRTGR